MDIENLTESLELILPKYKETHTAIELQYYIDIASGKEKIIEKGLAFCDLRRRKLENSLF